MPLTTSAAEEQIRVKTGRFCQWVLDAFRDMTTGGVPTTVSKLRFSAKWPVSGALRFTRDADGKEVKIWHENHKVFARAT